MPTLRFSCPPEFGSLVIELRDAITLATIVSGLPCTEVAPGLYTCDVGARSGIVYVLATQGPFIGTGWANLDVVTGGFVDVFRTQLEAQQALGGDTTPGTTLSVDYSHEWLYVDGVENGGYEFGPQRAFRGTAPVAPSTGVMLRRANPTKADLISATSMGVRIETTDIMVTLWSETLAYGSILIEPARGDFISLPVVLDDAPGYERVRILNLTRTVDGAQWRCYCRFATE